MRKNVKFYYYMALLCVVINAEIHVSVTMFVVPCSYWSVVKLLQ